MSPRLPVPLLAGASSLLALGSLALAYVTNPFTRFTIVRGTYTARFGAGGLQTRDRNDGLVIRQHPLWRSFAYYSCAVNVLGSRYLHSPGSGAGTVDGIIADIHALRFDPERLLLISGDQFTALFVRNLGVFYYPMLDRSVPGSPADWQDREIVYLQTLGYALGVFAKQPELTTTIVATGRRAATCVNIYAYPSDTLYGMLYALAALAGLEPGRPAAYAEDHHPLDTVGAAAELLERYGSSLVAHFDRYLNMALDPATGLVRTDLKMSGAKDITQRSSAFYDNVILWKTSELAQRLGLVPADPPGLAALRQRILDRFWLPERGHFLEDLSPEATATQYYSSDWLIVLATGFLDPADPTERAYLERSIEHIRSTGVAEPFAIKYHTDTRAHRQYPVVRFAVASYGGDSIWSFWGMEYVKTLLLLHRHTGRQDYLDEAGRHLDAYRAAMVRDNGFPEVYDTHGKMLTTPLYRSIRQTGWVIGFEQAREMYRAASAG
ncbi:hypothetical protein GA0111570_10392 [Raineyella antarctica]|uniref:Uncharacterized protein n=1 Tax=Raineyella antarctica TaxID=1577474 RepID=A0A1G6GFI0_9ACTN|nr:hypothetical protein [Raineyella antarctica]SDB80772.1 hypothetical protein GA0111570_10392 [Raineyella antarctica]